MMSETEPATKPKNKNKLKQTLTILAKNKVLPKSKAIKKPQKPAKQPIEKPLKIKSPKKPQLNYCDISYHPIHEPSQAKTYAGNRMSLSLFKSAAFTSEEPCLLCHQQAGLKTQTSAGQMHVICGMMCDQVTVDYNTFKMQLDEPLSSDASGATCDVCAKPGHLLRCLHKSCKRRAHAFCVLEQQKHYQIKSLTALKEQENSSDEEDDPSGWQLEYRFQDYTQQKFTQNQDLLQSVLNEYFDQIQLLTPDASPCKQESNNNLVSEQLTSRVNFGERGGKVHLMCEEHRTELEHCYCPNKAQSIHMVMCDYCNRWLHIKCEGLKSTEAKLLQEYKCTTCQQWDAKLAVKVQTDVQTEEQTWQRSILPTRLQVAYNLQQVIQVAQKWLEQADLLLSKPCSIEILKQQVIVAQYIPLKLPISKVIAKIATALAYQKSNPLPELQLSEDGDNQAVINECKRVFNEQLNKVGVVTEEAQEMYESVVEQAEVRHRARLVLSGSLQMTIKELKQLVRESDIEEEPLKSLLKAAQKWLKSEPKKLHTIQSVKDYLAQKPPQIKADPQVLADLDTSEQWDQLFNSKSSIEKLYMLQEYPKYKTELVQILQAEVKSVDFLRFLTNVNREQKCQSQLQEQINRYAGQSDIHKLIREQLQQVHQQCSHIKIQIDQIVTKWDAAQAADIQKKLGELPLLCEGEIQFNQICKVSQWVTKKDDKHTVTVQELDQIRSEQYFAGSELFTQAWQLRADLTNHYQLLEQACTLDSCQQQIGHITAVKQSLAKLGVIAPDDESLAALITKWQKADLTLPTKQLLSQLSQSLQSVIPTTYKIYPVLKDQLTHCESVHQLTSLLSQSTTLKRLLAIKDATPELTQRVKQAEQWHSEYQSLFAMTDQQLRKKLISELACTELISQATSAIERAQALKLEMEPDELKSLQRVKRWCSIVQQCYQIDYTGLEQLYYQLKSLKSLHQEIPRCQVVFSELQRYIEMVQRVDNCKCLQELKTELKQEFKELPLEAFFEQIKQQIAKSEAWIQRLDAQESASTLLQEWYDSQELQVISDEQVEILKQRVIKEHFVPGQQIDIKIFVKESERVMKFVSKGEKELTVEQGAVWLLAKQLAAKRRLSQAMFEMCFTQLPFQLPPLVLEQFKKAKERLEEIEKSSDLVDKKLENLQQLPFISQLEQRLLKEQERASFLDQLRKIIQELGDGDTVEEIEFTKYALDADCQQFYEAQRQIFAGVRDGLDQIKSMDQIFESHKQLSQLKIDFGVALTKLKRKLWHLKLDTFIKASESEQQHSDYLRYWIEEAQELALTKDAKFDLVSDMDDRADCIIKALKQCANQQDVELILKKAQELCPLLMFDRVVQEVSDKFQKVQIDVVDYLQKELSRGTKRVHDSDEQMTGLQQSEDEDDEDEGASECGEEEPLQEVKKKREVKAAAKTKTPTVAVSKKSKPAAVEKVAVQKPAVMKKTARPVAKKESDSKVPQIKGLAGGVKIGGSGIKSKLASLTKKSAKNEEEKPVDKNNEEEKPADDGDTEMKEIIPVKPVETEKPKLMKKATIARKQSNAAEDQEAPTETKKVEIIKKVVETKKAETKKVDEPKKVVAKKPAVKKDGKEDTKQEPSKQKSEVKKPLMIGGKQKAEAETAEKTPGIAKPAVKPIVGLKRLGGGGGLAASLKKLN